VGPVRMRQSGGKRIAATRLGQMGRSKTKGDTMTTNDDKSDILQARDELVAMGILRDSGRRRNGQIVWEITEAGKAHGKDMIDAAHEPKQ
jgi:hypothetical protein